MGGWTKRKGKADDKMEQDVKGMKIDTDEMQKNYIGLMRHFAEYSSSPASRTTECEGE